MSYTAAYKWSEECFWDLKTKKGTLALKIVTHIVQKSPTKFPCNEWPFHSVLQRVFIEAVYNSWYAGVKLFMHELQIVCKIMWRDSGMVNDETFDRCSEILNWWLLSSSCFLVRAVFTFHVLSTCCFEWVVICALLNSLPSNNGQKRKEIKSNVQTFRLKAFIWMVTSYYYVQTFDWPWTLRVKSCR